MKLSLFIPLLLFLVITPVFGQSLSDATGLVTRIDVQTGGHTFEVKIVSNFDIIDHEFDKSKKQLTIFVDSGLENNLGEVIIPQNLLGGNFTFYLNEQEFFPKMNSNEKISFITLNFTGSGNSKLDIFGTTYLDGLTERDENVSSPDLTPSIDYDYELIYQMIVLVIIVGGIIGIIVFVVRRKK